MINFFGLLSNKKKVNAKEAVSIYVAALNNVIDQGFIEIQEFINNNNNLDSCPEIGINNIDWFRNIVFLGNLNEFKLYFEELDIINIRALIIDEIYKDISINDQHLSIERFVDYENYFQDLVKENESTLSAMAYAIFEKYEINNHQGDLFKRKNKPNPIFYNELKNLMKHFLWNWEDYLQKNKIRF